MIGFGFGHLPGAAAWLVAAAAAALAVLLVGWAGHPPIVWWLIPVKVEEFVHVPVCILTM